MYLFYPETNGLHLEEVDQIFRDSKNIFDPPKRARHVVRQSYDESGMPVEKDRQSEYEDVSAYVAS